MSQLILGPCTLIQSVLEEALFNTPKSYFDDLVGTLQGNAMYLVRELSKIKGRDLLRASSTFRAASCFSRRSNVYDGKFAFENSSLTKTKVGIEIDKFKDIPNDVEFARKLLQEQVVFVLPGKIFKCENFVRLVICPPVNKLEEACIRIREFCENHLK